MVDRIRALELAGRLVTAYPGRNVTEDHAQAWADALSPLMETTANEVVGSLLHRSIDPPSVAQVAQAIAEATGKTMSPDYYGGGWRCTFAFGVTCPMCDVVHGPLLSHADLSARTTELRARLNVGVE